MLPAKMMVPHNIASINTLSSRKLEGALSAPYILQWINMEQNTCDDPEKSDDKGKYRLLMSGEGRQRIFQVTSPKEGPIAYPSEATKPTKARTCSSGR
jgi:hypothetical protein